MDDRDRELVARARLARERAHAPYSGFRVGAALRDADGVVHVGVNVENASLGLSVCAERNAVAAAVAAGATAFAALAVCGGGEVAVRPCGACRQVLREFGPDLRVFLAGAAGEDGPVLATTLADLLPEAFVDYPDGSRP